MSDRPTRETDAAEIDNSHFADYGSGPSGYVVVDLARKLERERDELREKTARQAERIRYLEGATNHAEGTPLSIALRERDELRAEVERLKADKARLDYCDTVIDLEPEHYVLRFPVRVSCTIRDAIDAAMKGDA